MGARCCKDMASLDSASIPPLSLITPRHSNRTRSLEVQLRSADFQYEFSNERVTYNGSSYDEEETKEAPMNDNTPALEAEKVYEMGMSFERGLDGLPKDSIKAFQLLKQAAEMGHAEAMYRVGLYYDRGIHGHDDSKLATEWYLKAAELGSINAQFSIGICYSKGIGIMQNDEEALKWLELAGKNKCDLALSSLGYFYEVGVCAKKDIELAKKYYQQAANMGNVFAGQRLNSFSIPKIVDQDEEIPAAA